MLLNISVCLLFTVLLFNICITQYINFFFLLFIKRICRAGDSVYRCDVKMRIFDLYSFVEAANVDSSFKIRPHC